jgi:phosphate uptake regulator
VLIKAGIAENFRFMVLEVVKQVEDTLKALDAPEKTLIESIRARDDYIDNLKSVIDNRCFSTIHRLGSSDMRMVNVMRAVSTVTASLEHIGDFAEHIVDQLQYLQNIEVLKRYSYRKFFKEILSGLKMTHKAVDEQDMSLAFKICRTELALDSLYKIQLDRILHELRSGKETQSLITSLFILRYLERMGDALLNVGEAVIFAAVGEKFKISQYESLEDTLVRSGMELPISDVEFESIWGTRSGCRIGRVSSNDGGKDESASCNVLFKEGSRKKLTQEKDNIERWEAILPGLPPRVLAHQEEGEQASLLVEFLGGSTLQDIVLGGETRFATNALLHLENTLGRIWEQTKNPVPTAPGFLRQLRTRLDDVFRLHPDFKGEQKRIGEHAIYPLSTLLKEVEGLAMELDSPYSVFIHGDFNINNIVYDPDRNQLHFVDLHRSRQGDPAVDIAVFLVSNFRLPVFDSLLRGRLNQVILHMLGFAKTFSKQQGDANFEARLALGIARNFITSTRFELDYRFARTMYLRGVYLLERLNAHPRRSLQNFKLPEAALLY